MITKTETARITETSLIKEVVKQYLTRSLIKKEKTRMETRMRIMMRTRTSMKMRIQQPKRSPGLCGQWSCIASLLQPLINWALTVCYLALQYTRSVWNVFLRVYDTGFIYSICACGCGFYLFNLCLCMCMFTIFPN